MGKEKSMEELVQLLDSNLHYLSHEMVDDIFYIRVTSNRTKLECPFCGQSASHIHSYYERSFQDLPIQGKKVIVILIQRKVFCRNLDCNHTTFTERFDFFAPKAKKTNRLVEELLRVSLNCSSVAAAELLSRSVADVGKSTICNLIKKRKMQAVSPQT